MNRSIEINDRPSLWFAGLLWCFLVLLFADVNAAPGTAAPVIDQRDIAAPVAGDELSVFADSPTTLRILYHRKFRNTLGITETEQRLIEAYAVEHGLEPLWIEVDKPWQLLNYLLEDQGDIIVGQHEGLAAGIQGPVRMLEPWAVSMQQVVARQDSARINKIEDLAYRQLAIKRSSPAWNKVNALKDKFPGMDIVTIPESMSEKEILALVKTGQYALTVMDSLFLDGYLPEHPELAAVFNLTDKRQMSWFVRDSGENLRQSLSTYLKKYLLALNLSDVSREDLPAMKEKKSIRLITYQSPTNLFYREGEIVGFEYELLNRFAKQYRMRVDLVLASSHEEMKTLLIEGKGDVIAASLPRRSLKAEALAHTIPYMYSAPVVVGRKADQRIVDIQDLEGRRVHLPAESPYRAYLENLRRWHGIEFQIIDAHDGMNTESTLFMVSQGMYDLTVVPSHQLKSEFERQIGLHAEFTLGEPESNVWVVRAADTKLLANLNEFIEREYKKNTYNNLYAQYIKSPRPQNGDSRLLARINSLSPYDREIQEAAERHDFDWRLIAAQMYKESQFNPHAVSPVGAEGLMQIMPA
ncbi:MAG: transporter substrate-binding domain-containing protein, partial [Gammaproteobacteria bacterium]|nr:transporter substrate-binding domain-containing protein [Gammaproteobacteria bacterium]